VNSVELLRPMSMLWNNVDCEDVQVVVIILGVRIENRDVPPIVQV